MLRISHRLALSGLWILVDRDDPARCTGLSNFAHFGAEEWGCFLRSSYHVGVFGFGCVGKVSSREILRGAMIENGTGVRELVTKATS